MFAQDFLARIRELTGNWLDQRYSPAAKRFKERRKRFETKSGLEIGPLYTPADTADSDFFENVGFPGQFPFTRGSYPIGYRSRTWEARQYCGFGTAEETNERLKFALKQGETGLNIIMDLPTSYHGIDADDPKVEGEVGKTGVSINSIEDMRDLFSGIAIDEISVTFNTTGLVVPAMYFAMAEERGLNLKSLRGTALNNPLASYVSCNSNVLPAPGDALREVTDMMEFALRETPQWNPMNIGSYEYRENGATAVQELGFMFGAAMAYCDAFIARGLDFDRFGPKLVFYTSLQTDFFEEVAKFRAARRMWAKIARDRYQSKNPASMIFRIHTQTSGLTLTSEQPLNNIVRTTIQSLAAVLGGTNSLYTDSYDEALCLPSEEGLRTAMRVQQVIMEESGVSQTIDPLGGSYFVESLTDRMEAAANEVLAEIEKKGGMVKAIESGWVQSETERSIAAYMETLEKGENVVVGYNKYRVDEPVDYALFSVDPAFELKQKARLQSLKAERNEAEAREALDRLSKAAKDGRNMMEPCMDAARARATFGEMTQAIYSQMESFSTQFFTLKARMFS
jgi:methylmalonyl-CoA mutase N-terminal domain/subunit